MITFILLVWFNDISALKSGWRTLQKNNFSDTEWSYLLNLAKEYKYKHLSFYSTLPFIIELIENRLYNNEIYRALEHYDLPSSNEHMDVIIGHVN